LLRKYAEIRPGTCRPRETLTPLQRRKAVEILESRIGGDITLAELADELDLSMAHFARAFKNSVGETPHVWLTKRRVARAKQLLAHTDLLLPEIALECGFTHRVSFSRAFANVTGVAPSEWRKASRFSGTMQCSAAQ
jgi:AraC family transcriptional regulator